MTGTVRPERISKDLAKLWVDLGKQQEHGVLRACAMTLVVIADETHDPNDIGEMIAGLMHEHPSRAIVLRVRQGSERVLDARVFAQCWMPFGRRQQICCEQVEITASLASLPDVPGVLRGITVPDLPVVLYCASPSLCMSEDIRPLFALADKLILDSGSGEESAKTLHYLNSLAAPKRRADLTWGRLTPWRDAVAQIFDVPANRQHVYSLENVNMLFKGREAPASVYYLHGWFMHVLGGGVHLNIAKGVGPACSDIARMDLIGPQFQASLDVDEGNVVDVVVNGSSSRVIFPELTTCDLLRRELGIDARDPIYEDSLGMATLLVPGTQ
jgi:glucose-6-phosphate dehydrogenase assembly protein OpcA